MAKKYLSTDEAAALLNLSVEQINSLREAGELRGFADRGTFKFKVDDIEEYARQQQTDSSPDVPLIDPDQEGRRRDEGPLPEPGSLQHRAG